MLARTTDWRTGLRVVLSLLGIAVYGQFFVLGPGSYLVVEEPTGAQALPEDADVVEYENLSATARRAFDRARDGRLVKLPQAFPRGDQFASGAYVHYQGTYYWTGILHRDMGITPSRITGLAGGFLAAVAIGLWVALNVVAEPGE